MEGDPDRIGPRTIPSPVPAGIRPHVLVVSDDPDLAEFLAEGLVVSGLWASVVASPFQALEVFRLRSFDSVVVDAALGGFGAVELVRRLRTRSDDADPASPRVDVPLFLIADGSGGLDLATAAAAEVDAVVMAPLELDVVAADIVAAVVRWRSLHPDRPWADQPILDSRTSPR